MKRPSSCLNFPTRANDWTIMFIRQHPTQEYLKSVFDYIIDGQLIWKERSIIDFSHTQKAAAVCASWNSRCANKSAGTKEHKGYIVVFVRFNNRNLGFKLHRLIYIWHNGNIPDGMQIDHIDGCTTNNSIENLRVAEHGQNRSNSKCNENSTTGIKGISFHKKCNKWQARVQKNNVRLEKFFDDIETADEWLRKQRKESHQEFANNGTS